MPSSRSGVPRSRVALVLAFAAVVLALALVDALVILAAEPDLQALRDIADDHARALQLTAHIRAQLSSVLRQLAASRGRPPAQVGPDVVEAFVHLQRDADTLLSLAATDPDASEAGALRAALARCGAEGRQLRALPGPEAPVRLESLIGATREAAEAADQIVSFSAGEVEQLSRKIRVHLRWLTVRATALALAGAVAAALLLRRALRSLSAEEAAAATRSADLEWFAARAAHELRTPLQTVSLALGALERGAHPHALQRARRSTERLRSTVDDLLEFARAGVPPGATSGADVSKVVGEVQEDLAPHLAAARVAIDVHVPAGTRVAMANACLATVLRNVVGNAVKYASGEGCASVTICATAGRAAVHLEVADNGPGIPVEALPRVFEPFFRATARSTGHGLGLATVRRLVEAHHGAVRITSAPGLGTRVELDLPGAGPLPPSGRRAELTAR